jgi:hypothetical protein
MYSMAVSLRYNLGYLWPSMIADQFYCEYKVHLTKTHTEIDLELPALELGEAGHAALVQDVPLISKQQIAQAITEGRRLSISEWTLEGSYKDVSIVGRPDLVAFEGQKARLILEFKFSTAKRPFPSHKVQALVYCFLLECMGFTVDELFFGIVLVPPFMKHQLHQTGLMKAEILEQVVGNKAIEQILTSCELDRMQCLERRMSNYRYDKKKVVEVLDHALKFWLNEREPIPVFDQPNKCIPCPFNAAGLCQHAKSDPHPAFQVIKLPNGRTAVFRRS